MLFRCARDSDLEYILDLAKDSGIGMTTLPKNKKILAKRLHLSSKSFAKKVLKPSGEYYLFVLEDPHTQKIVGVSAINSLAGYKEPFYSYKVSKRSRICRLLKIRTDYEVLSLVNDNQGTSEVCSLFLSPEFRKENNGLLLSKARFLFMALAPERFASTVIAELRGVCNEDGHSPFWDKVISHFFKMPFKKADRLTLAINKQFIADLMPRHPLYIPLLPIEAQSVIGQVNASSLSAMHILSQEGFRYNNYVDIFDAGPTLEAAFNDIKTISESHVMMVNGICDEVSSPNHLLASNQLDFRATISNASLNTERQTCTITKAAARLLKVQCGDTIRIAPLI